MSGCRVIPLNAPAESLVVQIEPEPAHPLDPGLEATIDARWRDMCAGNPRLFDGRILAFQRFNAERNVVLVRETSYRRMAVQPQVSTGVTQLGVTGILVCGDAERRRVLLGRRGPQTLLYSGRWELAPSGGVDAPAPGVTQLRVDDLRRQLAHEVHEELGMGLGDSRPQPVALCHDPAAPSIDVVFQIDVDEAALRTTLDWEYDDLLWLPLRELGQSLAKLDIIEPSVALLRVI